MSQSYDEIVSILQFILWSDEKIHREHKHSEIINKLYIFHQAYHMPDGALQQNHHPLGNSQFFHILLSGTTG
jgi:hypothetical protein